MMRAVEGPGRVVGATWPPLRSQARTYEHGLMTSGIKAVTQKFPDSWDAQL